ncbi:MAG: HlyD family secretion protein [Xanthobacteraceae bacterium]
MTRIIHIAVLTLSLTLAACGEKTKTYQGWVEANLIFVAPDEAGRIEALEVREGTPVETGAPLFSVDEQLQRADLNLNMAQLTMARQTFDRAQQLRQTGSGTQRDFDAAQSDMRVAEARVNSSQTRLNRRKMASPVTGTVQQVYFRPGEMVTAGRPVVSILPPGNLKLRFYVPEAMLPQISYNQRITVHCDNCQHDLSAKISFISKTAEFTPPVIYSLDERGKLVFLIEALPDQPEKFRLGQPIDVALDASEPRK